MRKFATIVLLMFHTFMLAQEVPLFTLKGQLRNAADKTINIYTLKGQDELLAGTAKTDELGNFEMKLHKNGLPSQCRLRIDQQGMNQVMDFFAHGEDIHFTTNYYHLTDSITFRQSAINIAWMSFRKQQVELENRLSLLDQLILMYNFDNDFKQAVRSEYDGLQQRLETLVKEVAAAFPQSLMSRYILSDRNPKLNPMWSHQEIRNFLQHNYLGNVDFTDSLLINTDIFPRKSMLFIKMFRDKSLDKNSQEKAFIEAVDVLFPLMNQQPVVYEKLYGYILQYFEQGFMDNVLEYIAETFPFQSSCEGDDTNDLLQMRLQGYKVLAKGNKAPPIRSTDINGNAFDLYQSENAYSLLVFWSVTCPHCTNMLPRIAQLVNAFNSNNKHGKKLKVIAVSFDQDKELLINYLSQTGINKPEMSDSWINIADFAGWQSPVAKSYYIYATPALLLLDDAKTIIAKPQTVDDIRAIIHAL